jgi:hypothetical protein
MSKRKPLESAFIGLDLNSSVQSNTLEEYQYERSRMQPDASESSSSSDSDESSEPPEDFFPKKRGRRSAIIKKSPDNGSHGTNVTKSSADISFLSRCLSQSFIFANLDYSDLLEIIYAMYLKKFSSGCTIVHKNDDSSELFVIRSGKIKIDIGEVVGPGSLVGEVSLLHDSPYMMEAVADEDTECWTLDRTTFIRLVRKTALHKRNKFKSLLKKAFKRINDEDIEKLVDGCKIEVFCVGEFLAKNSVNTGKLFVVYEGNARNLSQKKFEIFWESNLEESVVAESIVKCITLSKHSLERILGQDYHNYVRKHF